MTEPPFRTGQVIPAPVYAAMLPLDGRPKEEHRGVRLYAYRKRWWVTLFHTEFGEAVVGHWGPLGSPGSEERQEP